MKMEKALLSDEDISLEIKRLREELENGKEREKEFEKTRRAMLYLLEDNNEYAQGLLKSKNEWEATFDSITDLIFIHDSEMRIVKCNKAYQAVSNMSFHDIIGKKYYEVFPKMDSPFSNCVKEMRGDGKEEDEEIELLVPGTSKTFKVRFYAITVQENQDNFIHVMEDVTEEKKAAEREKVLYDFTHKVASNLDLDYRLNLVCETAVRLGNKMAWIGFPDETKGEVVPKAHAGFDDGYLEAVKIAFDESPLGQGPSGRAVRSRRPEIQNNIANDERFKPWKEQALKRGYRSVASFPVQEEDRVVAVLSIYSAADEFPEKEVPFLQSFANQTATYIRNARLFAEIQETSDKMKEEMEISKHLLMISYATAHTTDIDKLMEHVVESLMTIMNCDVCLSYLWEKERQSLQPCRAAGLPRETVPFFKVVPLDTNTPFLKQALSEKGPVMELAGTMAEDNPVHWISGLDAVIVIPLIRKDEVLGMLLCVYTGVDSRYSSGLTNRDRDVLGGISYQVSTALDEAKLFKESIDKTIELSRKVETIQIMHEIDKSILSTLEPKQILEITAVMVSKLINCDRATIALVDKERGGFIFEAGFGISFIPKGFLIPFSDTTATEVIKTGRPQYVPNLAEAKALLPLEARLMQDGFLSHIRVPLLVKGAAIGVLSIGSRRAAAFTYDDLSIVEKLASQLGVALENARLVSDLGELFIGIVKTLSEAIDAKSPWTRGHSERVTSIALEIGRAMPLNERDLKDLELAGLLHDIGKLGTYESILDKPDKLTEEEAALMRRHPQKGADILAHIKQMDRIVPGIKSHHENFDGSGYPDGLKGEDIPKMARILSVADTVDAMSADRPYRKGKSMDVITAEIKRCSGTQFDPAVVKAFLSKLDIISELKRLEVEN